MIRRGDEAFRLSDYDQALILYNRADQMLSDYAGFEIESPSKDARILQHYHNTRTLLKARMELTLLAREIGRLRPVTKRNHGFPQSRSKEVTEEVKKN
jgi:hypothetical protein